MTNQTDFEDFEGFKHLDDMGEVLPYLDAKSRELYETRMAIETNRILKKNAAKSEISTEMFMRFKQLSR